MTRSYVLIVVRSSVHIPGTLRGLSTVFGMPSHHGEVKAILQFLVLVAETSEEQRQVGI